jgi:peptidyl-prolyl cis-trans isomerase-like 4
MQNVLVDDRRIWVDLYVNILPKHASLSLWINEICFDSSQSVARSNTVWSNNPKMGSRRTRVGDGFAGRDDLEQTRRYRDAQDQHSGRDKYGMVFDVGSSEYRSRHESGRLNSSQRRRSKSPSKRTKDDHISRDRPYHKNRERRSRERGRD